MQTKTAKCKVVSRHGDTNTEANAQLHVSLLYTLLQLFVTNKYTLYMYSHTYVSICYSVYIYMYK